jgi:hypothetical protein
MTPTKPDSTRFRASKLFLKNAALTWPRFLTENRIPLFLKMLYGEGRPLAQFAAAVVEETHGRRQPQASCSDYRNAAPCRRRSARENGA